MVSFWTDAVLEPLVVLLIRASPRSRVARWVWRALVECRRSLIPALIRDGIMRVRGNVPS